MKYSELVNASIIFPSPRTRRIRLRRNSATPCSTSKTNPTHIMLLKGQRTGCQGVNWDTSWIRYASFAMSNPEHDQDQHDREEDDEVSDHVNEGATPGR